MKINFNGNLNGMGKNSFLNFNRVNQSLLNKIENKNENKSGKSQRRDVVTITAQGKANNLMDRLMKQRVKITEQKNELITSTIEKGGSMDSIKSQLESYEEQMKNIDKQITDMMTEEMEKQIKNPYKQEEKEPKTEQDIQNERLEGVASLAANFKQAKATNYIKNRIDGDARVLKSEIETDKKRLGSSKSARDIIAKKESQLAGMEENSRKLASEISDNLAFSYDEVTQNNKHPEVTPKTEMEKQAEEAKAKKNSMLGAITEKAKENSEVK
ncbi:MAG: hypothetical protein RR806_05245 [Oscillospiraceae bacterium]